MKRNAIVITISMLFIIVSAFVALTPSIEYCTGELDKFSSYCELKDFLQHMRYDYESQYSSHLRPSTRSELKAMPGLGYSKTNIQVEGVDEADIVKTDGKYIYAISGQKVVVVKAYPPEEAAVLASISVNGTLKQLFINADRLAVFYENGSENNAQTVVNVYDVSNRASPVPKSKIVVDGRYFSSRMIEDYVYVVARKAVSLENDEVNLPKICFNHECKVVSATDIYYSDVVDCGYIFTTILAVNAFEDEQEPSDETILSGCATNMYASLENVYLAIPYGGRTFLHRIHIESGEISIAVNGEVYGTVLNQFSMDEHEGYFRIATTYQIQSLPGEPWQRSLGLQNNIYVLNMNLEIIGRLESIAPGENIHSARFMGDVGYLVTFRKVDPFFVIDLSDPNSPKILGELKITGYSDYLHPYDENHVIGVGKETISAEEGDFSWYQGVKISLFDVTDVSKPKELAKYEIGDRGTDSPVLSEHKAFLFEKERSLLAIPVSVAEIDESRYPYGVPPYAYGEIVWQGAYVFTISLTAEEKIRLKGTVTHVEKRDVRNSSYHINRVLYIGEILYTISNGKIKMNFLSDLSEIKELNLDK